MIEVTISKTTDGFVLKVPCGSTQTLKYYPDLQKLMNELSEYFEGLPSSDKTQTPTPKARIDDRVYCVDCERGVGCPDWDPPDGWCTAGKPKVKTDG